MNTKQVIVVRTDLKNTLGQKVKGGKLVAQGSHASLGAVKDMMEVRQGKNCTEYILKVTPGSVLEDWWEGRFTKIALGCDSLQDLLEFQKQAKSAALPFALITDAGLTEFGGKPTITCLSIGPAESKDIDKITGHLKPL